MTTPDPRTALRQLFDSAVQRAHPSHALPSCLPTPPTGRTVVVGLGKAAADMAQVLESLWQGPLSGVVVVPDGHEAPCRQIRVLSARHPVPDGRSLVAATSLMAAVRGLTPQDQVIALVSGGGSSLAVRPAAGLTLADKQALCEALLGCGASIHEINTVRRQLSSFKGGHLAASAWPAKVHTIYLSDVPGDDPRDIASGPTLGASTGIQDAQAVLARHGIMPPSRVAACWSAAIGQATPDQRATLSLRPDDPRLQGHTQAAMATPALSLQAAQALARRWGMQGILLGDQLQGEARLVAQEHARLVRASTAPGSCSRAGQLWLSGGELGVTLRRDGEATPAWGCGGRNVEYLLALALALDGLPGVHALAADTDGIDGGAPVAGAFITPDTLARARRLGLDPQSFLDRHDAHGFFQALGDQLVTGPTRTNVNDFRAIWREPAPGA